jgi:hypothetical protein
MENNELKGITIQLLHISAQLDALTEYVMKNASQSEKDEIKKKIIDEASEKLRILDVLDSMIIPE